jgi:nitrite reductase/ring-hydroxylating ferredoxin subunit
VIDSERPAARFPFSPFPSGWYAVAFSRELRRRGLVSRRLAGREVVLFRGESGRAAMFDAHCPHLGAHLGFGGMVRGDALVCPMHGFAFDAQGHCVATGYDTKPPVKCEARAWPLTEKNGVLLAYFEPSGARPAWEPPDQDMRDFGPLRTIVLRGLRTHPQETTENSVDLGHLGVVHGYREIEVTMPLRTDGHYLTTAYRMRRRALFPGTPDVRAEFTIHAFGLGYSFVDVRVRSHALRMRHFVMATPTDGAHVDLHLVTAVAGDGDLGALVPSWLLDRVIGATATRAFLFDVRQDLPLWENKVFVSPPALAQGDGPIGKYRQWARQFYAPEPRAEVVALRGSKTRN